VNFWVQDLELIQEQASGSSSSHGSWNPQHATTAASTNKKGSKFQQPKETPSFDCNKYLDLQKSHDLLFDTWRERNGGLLLCGVKSFLHF